MKQLLPQPWDSAGEKYKVGERVRGVVTRLTDFGAFVELEPGVEGLIHLSELSWSKKMRRPADVVKAGESVEVVVLGVNQAERRISLGLKQALGDPWADAARKFPVGSVIEGPVVSLTKFGAFVQLSEGMEGMIHVGDVSAEKRIDHPQQALKIGQSVKAQVLEIDEEKRRLRLGMKQLVPTGLDEYIAEHKEGDVVTGRVTDISSGRGRVELGDGIQASFTASGDAPTEDGQAATAAADLSSLSSMLAAKWKGAAAGRGLPAKREPARAGQIRSFRVVKLDANAKKIELELA
jgi:small subunit ribosomal protein S1